MEEEDQAGSKEKEAANDKATHRAETKTQTHRRAPVTDSPPGHQLKTKCGAKGGAGGGGGEAGVGGKGKTYGSGMRNGGVGERDREAQEVHAMWQNAAKV